MLALLLVRLTTTRQVQLDIDSCTVPSGLLRLKPKRIVYADICDVTESFLPFGIAVLHIRDAETSVEIVATLLRDARSYGELRSFFRERQWTAQLNG